MKYIRTKDSVLEKEKTNIGKQYKLDIIDKDNGSIIDTVICDYVEDKSIIFDIIYAEYLITHHLDARNYNRKLEIIDNSLIIKQADTIEELCDMFVVWEEEHKAPVEMPLTQTYMYEKMKKVISVGMKANMNCWLKLAIWTDKGLIYVAKMNDKGELELL